MGLSERADISKEDTIDVENIREIIQRLELEYPQDYYSYNIFVNGITLDEKSRNLRDGDEVVIVPILSGG